MIQARLGLMQGTPRSGLARVLMVWVPVLCALLLVAPKIQAASPVPGYPNKAVRIVVGYPAGGGIDILMRLLAQELAQAWASPFVVENRPGAAGAVALQFVSNAAPDGHTILADGLPIVYGTVWGSLDVFKSFVPVVRVSTQNYLLLLSPSVPVSSVKELIAYAKARPDSLTYASSGVGSPSQVGMELLKWMAGMPAMHVPYKGVPQALTDMMSGQVSMTFGLLISSAPQVKAGKLKAIAVTAQRRSELFPDLPTMAEAGLPNFELTGEYALYVPAGTAAPVVSALNRETNNIIATPAVKERFAANGADPAPPNTPAEFQESLRRNIGLLREFSAKTGFKAE
jgi:tripartite-type tricarboxylate transporter receptor subunit TctC